MDLFSSSEQLLHDFVEETVRPICRMPVQANPGLAKFFTSTPILTKKSRGLRSAPNIEIGAFSNRIHFTLRINWQENSDLFRKCMMVTKESNIRTEVPVDRAEPQQHFILHPVNQ